MKDDSVCIPAKPGDELKQEAIKQSSDPLPMPG